MLVQVNFIVPGALPELFEHRACRIARQCLADVLVRLTNDCEIGFDFCARGGIQKSQLPAKIQCERIACGHVTRILRFIEGRSPRRWRLSWRLSCGLSCWLSCEQH